MQKIFRKRFSAKAFHDFPLKNFCLTVTKKLVEETFCVSEKFRHPKMLGIREGGIHVSPSKLFCLTVPKNIVGEAFCYVFPKISGSEKVYQ